uniref:Uncharacterized protein n=1 Tax=Vitis vinifera TaxID=29760 RepID=A5AGR7_VITVI|nr:hypothetical protein VITISV_003909 [Vitis vinifera]
MRNIWPSEDNCSRLVRNSHNTLKFAQHLQLVRSLCEIRTTPSACAKIVRNSHNTFSLCEACAKLAQHLPNSHSPCVVRIFLCSADSTLDLFF